MSDEEKTVHHYTPSGWVEVKGETHQYWGTADHYEEVKKRLSTPDHEVTGENFLAAVVFSLAWGLKNASASITGIYCDQWCGVSASGAIHGGGFFPMPDEGAEQFSTFIQCDWPEWGVAATWLAFVEKFGLREEEEENEGS